MSNIRKKIRPVPSLLTGGPAPFELFDRFNLYELCAQAPEDEVRFLRAVHGREPRSLRDDFAGAAGVARAWARLGGSGTAVDLDETPLAHAERRWASLGSPDTLGTFRTVCADALACTLKADVVCAFNFAVCELHTRAELVRYLTRARSSLKTGGVFACDLYGGRDAYSTGRYVRNLRGPSGEMITYTWEQRAADPLTARVENAMHFEVRQRAKPGRTGEKRGRPRVMRDAFVYHWRLWTIAEVREAMAEAGLGVSEVYDRYGDARASDGSLRVTPLTDPAELDENYVVYIVGKKTPAR